MDIGNRGLPYLNVAQIWIATSSLGPGLRSVVWTQGCSLHCEGCVSPEWIPDTPAMQYKPDELAVRLLERGDIQGLTFSGGEPMLQAAGLAELVSCARKIQPLNVICFTGFTYEKLLDTPLDSTIHKFLNQIDVLIDGPYVAKFNDNIGMRGSSNQRIIYLTELLKNHRFDDAPRRVEIHLEKDYAMMIGVPPTGFNQILEEKFSKKSKSVVTTRKGD